MTGNDLVWHIGDNIISATSATSNYDWVYVSHGKQDAERPGKTNKPEKWLRGRVREICDMAKFQDFQ